MTSFAGVCFVFMHALTPNDDLRQTRVFFAKKQCRFWIFYFVLVVSRNLCHLLMCFSKYNWSEMYVFGPSLHKKNDANDTFLITQVQDFSGQVQV